MMIYFAWRFTLRSIFENSCCNSMQADYALCTKSLFICLKKINNFHFLIVKMAANHVKPIAQVDWRQVFNKFYLFKISEIFTILL